MRRLILAAALWPLMNVVANAACPGTPSTCGDPMMAGTSSTVMYASAYGVKADGTTSDDAALKAAVDACVARGGRLLLPPGRILLTGAIGSIFLANCKIEGAGFPGYYTGQVASAGTTLLITNTTTPVFSGGVVGAAGSGFALEGFSVYWPNQTGNVVYPAFFKDIGGVQVNMVYMRHMNLINCYQCFVQNTSSDWGNWIISDSNIYAVKDAFSMYSTCEGWTMSGIHASHEPWAIAQAGQGGGSFTLNGYLNIAVGQNTFFHIAATAAGCPVSGLLAIGGFAWKNLIVVEDGGHFIFDVTGGTDGTGTILKLNGSGSAQNSKFSGPGWVSCTFHFPTFAGDVFGCDTTGASAPAAFDLGVGLAPIIQNFHAGVVAGNFISSAGAGVVLSNVDTVFGRHNNGTNDTTDYYCVHFTANTGGTGLSAKNLRCGAQGTTGTKMHGVVSDVLLAGVIIQGLETSRVNEGISIPTGSNTYQITDNNIVNTQGSASVAFPGSGAGGVLYSDNIVDKPALAVCTGCGTGYSISGGFRGEISMGTGTVTAFTLQLPWATFGAPACQFNPEGQGVTIGGTASGNPPVISVTASTNIAGGRVAFDCMGKQ